VSIWDVRVRALEPGRHLEQESFERNVRRTDAPKTRAKLELAVVPKERRSL
jgi:hypothetical protein